MNYLAIDFLVELHNTIMLNFHFASTCAGNIFYYWIWFAFILVEIIKLTPIDVGYDGDCDHSVDLEMRRRDVGLLCLLILLEAFFWINVNKHSFILDDDVIRMI